MRILIGWADDASPNLGVRALGKGSIDVLRSVFPDAEIEMMNYGRKPDSISWPPRSLVKERVLNRTGMMAWLRSFDLYWDTRSGDSFADIYGMHRHLTMSLIHEFAAQAGVRCVMAPQTIGPFRHRRGRALARRNLRRSDLVFARDPISASVADELGRPVDALTTDMVFAVTQPPSDVARDVIVNVSGLLWSTNPHVDHEQYRESIVTVIRGLLEDGRTVSLLPHVLTSADPDNDVPAVDAVKGMFGDEVEVLVPQGLDDARAAIGSANLVIGARMHACLNALSTGTPAVAMAYSRKFRPLLADLGWDAVVDIRDADTTSTAVLEAARRDLTQEAAAVQREGAVRIDTLRTLVADLT
ncbi:polysaccharide pyruvyl transferase family protein [Microbacterium koreense]|uniref:Polysaccharide pyruvyl transferase family protein n=1 Tax=Microbacterium koreense TaxID=323761 RepID=A0ABW2ZP13_9MICO